jgi:hypothetical protein
MAAQTHAPTVIRLAPTPAHDKTTVTSASIANALCVTTGSPAPNVSRMPVIQLIVSVMTNTSITLIRIRVIHATSFVLAVWDQGSSHVLLVMMATYVLTEALSVRLSAHLDLTRQMGHVVVTIFRTPVIALSHLSKNTTLQGTQRSVGPQMG